MSEDPDTPLGVKMLADHLVKVKMQYEEQINDMLVKMRGMEKEKDEMKRQYKLLEDELEQRRNEIFQLKRANNAQYVMEERENWRAMVTQQKQEIEKLKKGSTVLFVQTCRSCNCSGTHPFSSVPLR
ncbi:uncharacterized protein [Blastocystis hominis]|uniref:Uncharacterized protein n=1 Tax=Blastocystis hominis TaxID=12968 RepID=D8M7H7_BLAHO|nr:uncharacterized protein [Blastocystis hominis]CBK24016.2 unnamed protein product [Blastocystis hominis]|eukprot:XP_012898064.1 uncharacterized protein [Blastocystis hominis]